MLSNHNKHELESATLVLAGKNPSCGDELQLYIQLENGIIENAAYGGSGCAISQASISIMIDLVRGKTKEEALRLCSLFLQLMRHDTLSEQELQNLGEAVALERVSNLPARIACATLGWHTLEAALQQMLS